MLPFTLQALMLPPVLIALTTYPSSTLTGHLRSRHKSAMTDKLRRFAGSSFSTIGSGSRSFISTTPKPPQRIKPPMA